eukprot:gnl/TRDRNA2_/TRDRNA2_174892_c6_seq4.p2 gnl/TRDRNA2_/TRDRNA2_174892_c6~~gnl/TRDRNA2_/TRDRNA2_174892_c6_seq4.p2  ORF type:complete len:142 (+),score=53.41 gnl/TRDRNA2_/TRDRNA2_174892_c6_seq4:633-1058(+)
MVHTFTEGRCSCNDRWRWEAKLRPAAQKSQAVAALAAERELDLGELKLQPKRGPVPKKSVPKATKSKSDDELKTKRKMTGYLLFSKEMRPQVKEALEAELEEDEKLKPQAVVTELAAQWKALSDEEQAEWKERAAAESDRE